MRMTLILTLMLLGFAFRLQAQQGIPGRDIWQTPGKNFPTTIAGCLESSGGHYTVTHKDGTVYDLTGDTARLSRYVGHEVEITGKPTVRTINTTQTQTASTAVLLPALEVESAKEISKACTSASYGKRISYTDAYDNQ